MGIRKKKKNASRIDRAHSFSQNDKLKEVTSALLKMKTAPHGASHTYKTNLKVLWVRLPEQRKLLREGFSFSKLPHQQQVPIWREIYQKSPILEVKNMALIYYQQRKKHPKFIDDWSELRSWVDSIENWIHSDMLSDLYATIFEASPQKLLPTFKKWNQSKAPWKKRQSLVSLFYYARARKAYPHFNDVESLILPLLHDDDYYVQKGIGWTLRESSQAYPDQTHQLIIDNLGSISSTAFTAAVEKYSLKEKEKLKSLRKQLRKSQKKGH